MGPHEAPHLAHAENLWFDWFRDGTLNSDIDDAGMKFSITLSARSECYEISGGCRSANFWSQNGANQRRSKKFFAESF